jgi:predicted nucleic acid-binding Zn ribbon protein
VQRLADDVDRFARRYGLRRGVEAAAVLKAAREVIVAVVPTALAVTATPSSFRSGTLTVQAPSGAALASLAAYRGALLDALSARLGPNVVQRVLVRPLTADEVAPSV